MYLFKIIDDQDDLMKTATEAPPFGPGFGVEELKTASSIEIWCSSFSDRGSDYTLFKLKNKSGALIAEKKKNGY